MTGLPGVGKTAVSLAAARAAAAGFADGSLLLRLDTLRDEALLPHTIAAALRLSDQYTRSRLDVLELAAAELARLGQVRPPTAALADMLTRLETGHAARLRPPDAASAGPGRGVRRAA